MFSSRKHRSASPVFGVPPNKRSKEGSDERIFPPVEDTISAEESDARLVEDVLRRWKTEIEREITGAITG